MDDHPLHRKCEECGRKTWLGDMVWRGVKRLCQSCAIGHTYE